MTFNITNMLKPEVYNHPCHNIELIETHISWVILTGDFAYKIKKPVDFGFLDFSTLAKRKYFCKQELHLNRRLAADIYLELSAITGTEDRPQLAGSGEIIEYAVKMKQFPQSAQLDNMLAAGELKLTHMNAFADMAANFHQSADVADISSNYGSKETVYHPVEENFQQIAQQAVASDYTDQLATLSQWSQSQLTEKQSIMAQRKANGFIRHGHGDMHLRNMLWLNNKAMAFDCIEFNESLSWIDVISDIAFLIMDLQHRQQQPLANRFLNHYLEISGDYAALPLLPFYLCYRAMVRAKVSVLRLAQNGISTQQSRQIINSFESYLELAGRYTKKTTPQLIIMRGLSASGKSTLSQQLLDHSGMIRIRSDIERKRLFANASQEATHTAIDAGIYSRPASQQTYDKLRELACNIIKAGYSVIVDAAFLKQPQRKAFQQLASQLNVPYTVLETNAPDDVLRQRISKRKNDVSDADLTVLEHQLANWQPLKKTEQHSLISIDTTDSINLDALINRLNRQTKKDYTPAS